MLLAAPAVRLAAERVTLDDMSDCMPGGGGRSVGMERGMGGGCGEEEEEEEGVEVRGGGWVCYEKKRGNRRGITWKEATKSWWKKTGRDEMQKSDDVLFPLRAP